MPAGEEAATMHEPKHEAKLLTLDALALKHGQTQRAPIAGDSPFTADHLVAEQLHGWSHHALYVGEVLLSDEDYLAAIEAAKEGKRHFAADKGKHTKEEAAARYKAAQLESKKRIAAKGKAQ